MAKLHTGTTLWKITNAYGYTRITTQWGYGVIHDADKLARQPSPTTFHLCTSDVIHAYTSPLLGMFLNPIHGGYHPQTLIMWEAEGKVVADDGEKVGCKILTTWRTIDVAVPNDVQKRAFAILSTLALNGKGWHGTGFTGWKRWAEKWLSGEDRTEESRRTASAYAYASAYASYSASAYAASYSSPYLNGPRIAAEAMEIR